MAMTPYYREKLEQGLHYQDYVVEKLYEAGLPIISYSSKKYQQIIGENKAGIEIKNDAKFRGTGNFYIEVAEKSNPANDAFVLSGVYRNDNTWLYIVGDVDSIFIFSKKQLRIAHESKKFREVATPTSRGFLLPVSEARKYYAIKIIES